MRPRHPDPEYLKLLMPYGEMIQKLALAARKLILEEAPSANEFVYEVYTIADHFVFTERPSDAFVFTTTHANWLNLGFNFGSLLIWNRPAGRSSAGFFRPPCALGGINRYTVPPPIAPPTAVVP